MIYLDQSSLFDFAVEFDWISLCQRKPYFQNFIFILKFWLVYQTNQ